MESVSEKARKMKHTNKFCSIIFDEMALDPTLQYDKMKDIVHELQDNGDKASRRPLRADKVMVFHGKGNFQKMETAISLLLQ